MWRTIYNQQFCLQVLSPRRQMCAKIYRQGWSLSSVTEHRVPRVPHKGFARPLWLSTGSPSHLPCGTQPVYCLSSVSVHYVQTVLRSPRTPLSGGRSRPSLEPSVPAIHRLAASRPLSVETENLPGTVEGERISCRSHRPSSCFSPRPNAQGSAGRWVS